MGDFGYAAGLLHDVGKVNPKFQEYLRKCAVDPMELTRTKIPHSVYGCYLCEKDLEFIRPIIAGQHAGIYAMREMADLLNRHRKEAESIQTLAGEFILQHLWHAELPEHTERRIMSGPPSRDTNLNFHVVTGANNALRFSLFPSLNEAVDPAPTQTIR
jgi:CRISPR/Cas system-associated endonuclease Cas3-HD